MTNERLRASADIKLLRQELLPSGSTPCDGIDHDWTPAQPSQKLSPTTAAKTLGVPEDCLPSDAKSRYRALQLRFPPEQFMERHLNYRPAAELLSSATARLNWYWQSGQIPPGELTFNEKIKNLVAHLQKLT